MDNAVYSDLDPTLAPNWYLPSTARSAFCSLQPLSLARALAVGRIVSVEWTRDEHFLDTPLSNSIQTLITLACQAGTPPPPPPPPPLTCFCICLVLYVPCGFFCVYLYLCDCGGALIGRSVSSLSALIGGASDSALADSKRARASAAAPTSASASAPSSSAAADSKAATSAASQPVAASSSSAASASSSADSKAGGGGGGGGAEAGGGGASGLMAVRALETLKASIESTALSATHGLVPSAEYVDHAMK